MPCFCLTVLFENFSQKLLTFLSVGCIITIEKGKTSNGYAKLVVKKITLTLACGGLFFLPAQQLY
jgi:hypothetical protein